MKKGQKPHKHPRLGQHFLTSQGALENMRDASDVHADDIVLEIGPGKGVLTKSLIILADKVIAVEKDPQLVAFLAEKFSAAIQDERLVLIEGDILDFDPRVLVTYAHKKQYKIIANIPYYITGEIIRKFLTAEYKPQSMTLLIQKEVAERIVAKDGKESVLSLSVKFFGVPSYISTVKRGSFNPPPNVDSAIIHIENIVQTAQMAKETPLTQKVLEKDFFTLIKAGFQSKRKKVISNIATVYDKEKVAESFRQHSIDENTRAEDLMLEQWLLICADLHIDTHNTEIKEKDML